MKRATEDHVVKGKDGVTLQGGGLTSFLLNVQEYGAVAAKLGRRMREAGLVGILAGSGPKEGTEFHEEKWLADPPAVAEKSQAKVGLTGASAADKRLDTRDFLAAAN